jgi:ribosomal protein L14
MIQLGTILKVIDNSMVREIRCIKVVNGTVATQGDLILGTVYRLRAQKDSGNSNNPKSRKRKKENMASGGNTKQKNVQSTLSKGDLVSAIVVRTKKALDRSKGIGKGSQNQTGIKLSFPNENAVMLINFASGKSTGAKKISANIEPLATRSKGPITPVIASKGYSKLLSLGSNIL